MKFDWPTFFGLVAMGGDPCSEFDPWLQKLGTYMDNFYGFVWNLNWYLKGQWPNNPIPSKQFTMWWQAVVSNLGS